MVSHALL